MPKIVCETCADTGWVCENHRDRPWLKPLAGCLCGAGAPCPRCNTFDDDQTPDISGVIETIDDVGAERMKRKLN